MCSVHGKSVTTVEGVGSLVGKKLHPIQERLAKAHGSQCGFCTPGFVMAMYALLRNNPAPTQSQIDEALQGSLLSFRPLFASNSWRQSSILTSHNTTVRVTQITISLLRVPRISIEYLTGNLCRCTGYRPILEAFYSFSKGCCKSGGSCCRSPGENGCCRENATDLHMTNGPSSIKNEPHGTKTDRTEVKFLLIILFLLEILKMFWCWLSAYTTDRVQRLRRVRSNSRTHFSSRIAGHKCF